MAYIVKMPCKVSMTRIMTLRDLPSGVRVYLRLGNTTHRGGATDRKVFIYDHRVIEDPPLTCGVLGGTAFVSIKEIRGGLGISLFSLKPHVRPLGYLSWLRYLGNLQFLEDKSLLRLHWEHLAGSRGMDYGMTDVLSVTDANNYLFMHDGNSHILLDTTFSMPRMAM